jgi:hypothetical protein
VVPILEDRALKGEHLDLGPGDRGRSETTEGMQRLGEDLDQQQMELKGLGSA